MFDYLLKEDGDLLLQETGGGILLDTASAQYLWIGTPANGTSFEGRMRLGSFAFTECADNGRVGTGGFDIDDDSATAEVAAFRDVTYYDFRAGTAAMAQGFTHGRSTERGPNKVAGQRNWNVEVLDLNSIADHYVFTNVLADRPIETDYERITWLVEDTALNSSGNVSAGFISSSDTVTMDAVDYRGRKPREVLDQCAEITGKNWHIYNYTNAADDGVFLFYGMTTDADVAGVSISDVASDYNGTTVLAPSGPVTVTRNPDEIYSTVVLTWAGGVVTATNEATATNYRTRMINLVDMAVRTNTTAQAKADAFIAASSTERITLSDVDVLINAADIDLLRAGMLVSMKLTRHGIDDYEPYLITSRTLRAASDTKYLLTLSLSNTLAPTRYMEQRGANEVWEVKSNATQDGASVIVNRDGITVTEGAITVTNAGDVVIIDGTSNMFKIAATGTVSTSTFVRTPGASSTVTTDIATGFTYRPAFLSYIQLALGAYLVNYATYNLSIANAGVTIDALEAWVEVVSTDQTRFSAKLATARDDGGTQAAKDFRYYILTEAAI